MAPSWVSTQGAATAAAPFPQSTTTLKASRRRPSSVVSRRVSYSRRAPSSTRAVPTAAPSTRVGAARPASSASSSASKRASISSVSLRPPRAKNLMPLSGNRLWLADRTAAGQSRLWLR